MTTKGLGDDGGSCRSEEASATCAGKAHASCPSFLYAAQVLLLEEARHTLTSLEGTLTSAEAPIGPPGMAV